MRATALAALTAIAVFALAACSPPVSDLEPGDCFLWSDLGEEVDTVPTIPCADPHDGEVYAIFDLDLAEFDQAAIDAASTARCETEYEEYVGIAYWDSEYYYLSFTPTEEGWRNESQRQVICFIWPGEGLTVEGSLKGTRD